MLVSAHKFTHFKFLVSKIIEARTLHVSNKCPNRSAHFHPAFKVAISLHIIVMTYNNMTSFWL